jgi:glycyl-tRNA synthetase beta chain
VKVLADLPAIGVDSPVKLGPLLDVAEAPFTRQANWDLENKIALLAFLVERCQFVLGQRGYDIRNVRAVTVRDALDLSPLEAKRKLEALGEMTGSEALLGVATLFKRVRNITKGVPFSGLPDTRLFSEPAEQGLVAALAHSGPAIREAAVANDYRRAFSEIGALQPPVAKFFEDVLVMTDDAQLRDARLRLLAGLRDTVLDIADISEIVTD